MRPPDAAAPTAWWVDRAYPGQVTTRDLWALVVALATAQWGVVARRQLVAARVPEWLVDEWVERRLLHPWYRGVYAVGHRALRAEGRRKAAELAGGEDAALCCQTAADFLGLKPCASGTIHIWVPNQRGREIGGIVPHRFADMLEGDIDRVGVIRTTSAMRVLADMAHAWSEEQIMRAFDRAEELRQFDLRALKDLMDRRPNRPGSPKLRMVLALYEGPEPTLTELEKRGLQLIRKAGLPKPMAQWPTSEGRVDFYFPEARLILEMDSFRWHKSRIRFEGDRSRDLEHMAQGMATPRVTWHQALKPETIDRLRRLYRNRLVG